MSDIAKCPLCQQYIDLTFNSGICPKCGQSIAGLDIQPDPPSGPYGVGGWLLLLCVGLTVLGPLLNINTIKSSITMVNQLNGAYPPLEKAINIEVGLLFILIFFSFYAGISLWAKRPHAVKKAKIFLITLAVFSIADLIIVLQAVPPSVARIAVNESFPQVIRPVLTAIVWYAYLSNSQRVQNTYPSEN